ncbi:MAG: hypothetical protein EOP49_47485 [Sphingobacteriales bacterium]|nr:MAG: hypothetical protein EOP49_47485 [Sphingobacteriales bacterium]
MGLLKLFGKRKEAEPLAPAQEKAVLGITERILAMQRFVAAKLNAGAEKMGIAITGMLIAALLLGFAVYCSYLVLGAVF